MQRMLSALVAACEDGQEECLGLLISGDAQRPGAP